MADNARLANQLANRGSSNSAAWAKELAGTPDLLSSLSSLVMSKPVDTATKGVATTTSTGSAATGNNRTNGGSSQGGTPSGVGKATPGSTQSVGKVATLAQIAGILTGMPELALAGKFIGTANSVGTNLEQGNTVKAALTGLGFVNPVAGIANSVDSALGWLGTQANEAELEKRGKPVYSKDGISSNTLGDIMYSVKPSDQLSVALNGKVDIGNGMLLTKDETGKYNINWSDAALAPQEAAPIVTRSAGEGLAASSATLSPAVLGDILGVAPYQSYGRSDGRSDGFSGSTPSGASPSWGNAMNERIGSTSTQSDTGNTSEGRTDNSDGKSSDMGGVA